MENWAQSKQQPGQFTGSTGANILSAAELSSGYQAWARKVFNSDSLKVYVQELIPMHLCYVYVHMDVT